MSDTTTAQYSYNLTGLRESKTVNGETTRYIYKGADIIGEVFEDKVYKYYRGTELLGYETGMERGYYRISGHGDVTAILNESGAVLNDYRYDAYGNKESVAINPQGGNTVLYQWKQETERTHNPFGYCGEYLDDEMGFIYLRNRYYDPSTARFITEDPIRSGLNWYAYCGGNPVMFFDPLGLAENSSFSAYARAYLKYYDGLAETAGNQALTNKYNALKNDIIRLDPKGEVEGKLWDVPLYLQGTTNMCYAYAEMMVSQTNKWFKYTQEQAVIEAEIWAADKYGKIPGFNYKDGGSPGVSRFLKSEDEMIEALNQSPIYTFNGSHVWVITGYAKASKHDIIYTINDSQYGGDITLTRQELFNYNYTSFRMPSLNRIEEIQYVEEQNIMDIRNKFTGHGTVNVILGGQISAEIQVQP